MSRKPRKPHPLAPKALALRGRKSMGLIGKELGVTRNVIAGIFFRADHPREECIARTGDHRMIGTGHGPPAPPYRWPKKRLPSRWGTPFGS